MTNFLVHDSRDTVGVAVTDLQAAQTVRGVTLDSRATIELTALQDIPFGHKIALRDFDVGDTVTKYGEDIGKVVAAIKKGGHVHVHNLKTKRW
jgi:(2R)-sulfolactate sulfo-lyase subunit alpha